MLILNDLVKDVVGELIEISRKYGCFLSDSEIKFYGKDDLYLKVG